MASPDMKICGICLRNNVLDKINFYKGTRVLKLLGYISVCLDCKEKLLEQYEEYKKDIVGKKKIEVTRIAFIGNGRRNKRGI